MPAAVASVGSEGLADRLDEILGSDIHHRIEEDGMRVWDKGVFLSELQRQGIVLSTGADGALDGSLAADTGLKKGTYHGTQMALTEFYSLIEEAALSHLNAQGLDPIIPQKRGLKRKQEVYQWSDPAIDGYPPHLQVVPPSQSSGANAQIFDPATLTSVQTIGSIFSFLIPDQISHGKTPYLGPTIADCEKYNSANSSGDTDIMNGSNVGERKDWYSDACFAQQHLSGVNPTTIEAAPAEKVQAYIVECERQGLTNMKSILSESRDLFIQDYSYFREATGLTDEQTFQNIIPEVIGGKPTGKISSRFACASVVLFKLHEDGRLHPLAITLDYRGSLDKSVTLFNRRLTPDEECDVDEKSDWPWRYAKTCAQTADWARHEIAVHLVDTHMVEEAIIVATHRTIPEDHLLYEILSPHWFRTLPLNAAARSTLVPAVIARLCGFGPTINPDPKTNLAYKLVDYSYKNFNFQDKYIPNDLKKRGFDIEGEKGDKYRNYPYAADMYLLWGVIRRFVRSVLKTKYKGDADVQNDAYIPDWCTEIQTKGQLPSFPTITTVDQLVNAVTMCIHIASPQHTAVNYLQEYYYGFVPSKPPALCTPLPQSLEALQAYTEQDLTAALPIGTENGKWKDWLLAAQLPRLLSFKVENQYNLITYAKSLYSVNKHRTSCEKKEFDSEAIKEAAAIFYSHLKDLSLVVEYNSAIQTEGNIEYNVLRPDLTAVSILI